MPGFSRLDSFLPPILDDTGTEIEEPPAISKGMQISELFNNNMLMSSEKVNPNQVKVPTPKFRKKDSNTEFRAYMDFDDL